MVVSTRHLHKRNLGRMANNNAVNEEDDFIEQRQGNHNDNAGHNHNYRPSTSPPRRRKLQKSNSIVLNALSDENSSLARFLFIRGNNNNGNDSQEGQQGDDDHPRINSTDVNNLALALEPMQIRNERVIWLFEAYAIFAALFLNGVWIIYEWGSAKGYGGYDTHATVNRVFECVMAIALGLNVLMALISSGLWINSLYFSSGHEEYVLHMTKPLAFLLDLWSYINGFIAIGLFLGIYSNLSPHWPETIVTWVIMFVACLEGAMVTLQPMLNIMPLEAYHVPLLNRLTIPQLWRRSGREELKTKAKLRAQKLKERAYQVRNEMDPSSFIEETNDNHDSSSVGALLQKAAANLGRTVEDVTAYEDRLKEDWYDDAHQLKDVSMAFLAGYMPHRLAKEVHRLLQAEGNSPIE